ncbi:hypothetical protein PENVUL_c011G01331 [Penicillium vulpinum]|uniref:Uncharacterized protein n=2 Tax=Penicillium vulpinum TaxID=29845 RepID=A0A1V6S1V7_9EURO|nr:hypothetical protein PENVUL_c011G01331 [Penicillium vulpinum]
MKPKAGQPKDWALLLNMARIHSARKFADPDADAAIYGIITDGLEWIFIHISNSSRYTVKIFDWSDHRDQIIAQVQDIIDKAVNLYKKRVVPRSSLRIPTIQQISGWRIEEIPATSNYFADSNDRASDKSSEDAFDIFHQPLSW